MDKDTQGNLIVNPLASLHTLTAGSSAIALRLGYFLKLDMAGGKPSGSVQLLLTPDQALEVAGVLHQAAQHILSSQSSKKLS